MIARPGVSLDRLAAAVDKELDAIRKTPMTDDDLVRATRLESVRERASLLNMYQAAMNEPGFAQKDLERYRSATKEGIRDTAAKYLDPNARVILRVVPAGKANEKGSVK